MSQEVLTLTGYSKYMSLTLSLGEGHLIITIEALTKLWLTNLMLTTNIMESISLLTLIVASFRCDGIITELNTEDLPEYLEI
jgi:hypothetical protein